MYTYVWICEGDRMIYLGGPNLGVGLCAYLDCIFFQMIYRIGTKVIWNRFDIESHTCIFCIISQLILSVFFLSLL